MIYKSFSCGRGVHRVFVFKKFLPVKVGYVVFIKNLNTSIELNNLTFFESIKAFFEYNRLKKSLYFSDTSKSIEVLLNEKV